MKIEQDIVDAIRQNIQDTNECYVSIAKLYLQEKQLSSALESCREKLRHFEMELNSLQELSERLNQSVVDAHGPGSLDLENREYTPDTQSESEQSFRGN